MRRRDLLASLVLFGSAVGCGRSCGCLSGETTYESLDGKVKVELVRDVRWGGGRAPGTSTRFFLRVHTTPPIEHGVACDHVDLAEDDAGTLVGYRCKGESPWNVLRLRSEKQYLFDCKAPVGTSKKPDFAKLEPVAKAADRIAQCTLEMSSGAHYPETDPSVLVRALEKDVGPEEAAAFVERFASADIPVTPWMKDRWDLAFAGLSTLARSVLAKQLCPDLANARAPAMRYVRAARTCNLDGDDVAAAATERFRAALASPTFAADQYFEKEAFRWAALLTRSGDVACDFVTKIYDARIDPTIAAIARTRTRCKTDIREKLGVPCGATILCDGGLCSADDTARAATREKSRMQELDAGLREPEMGPADGHVAALAAFYAQGPVSKEIVQRNARLTYSVTGDGGPNCGDILEAGAPCFCSPYGVSDKEVCVLPLDGGPIRNGMCVVRALDAKKRIEVTHACGEMFSECNIGSCCPGYRCEASNDSSFKECVTNR